MIDSLNEVLEELLVAQLDITNNEIDIVFEQPTREWSGRLNRPTLNLFLYDIRENVRLRNISPAWKKRDRDTPGQVTMQPPWTRLDLYYMITAWATEADDEYRLLARSLKALFRTPKIKIEDLPEELRSQPSPIMIQTAQPDTLTKPTDIWSVLDNDMRPAVSCVITAAIDPHDSVPTPLVRAIDMRIGPKKRDKQELEAVEYRWTVGGLLHTNRSIEGIRLTLVERGLDIPIQPTGPMVKRDKKEVQEWGVWGVKKLLGLGNYTLQLASSESNESSTFKIEIPSKPYYLQWFEEVKQVWSVSGKIYRDKVENNKFKSITLKLVDINLNINIPIQSDGTWKVERLLDRGKYTIEIIKKEEEENEVKASSRCEIEVPSNSYHLQWFDDKLKQVWSVGGWLETNKSLEGIDLTLVEHGLKSIIKSGGTWEIEELLDKGEYTIEIKKGKKTNTCKIKVPSKSYHLKWFDKLEQVITNPE